MTQEEKAKAYDEALERAIKHHDKDGLTLEQYKTINIIFPELKESEDERIRKILIDIVETFANDNLKPELLAWLEKQGEQKPTQEIEPFEAEHGKYYYCIKDYFCGGRKQASKGDIVQALRGLPIMGLKDAGEYFLPVNSIKCNSAWSEEDEIGLSDALWAIKQARTVVKDENDMGTLWYAEHWLKSLKPQNTWKPSDEQMADLWNMLCECRPADHQLLQDIYYGLKKLREE